MKDADCRIKICLALGDAVGSLFSSVSYRITERVVFGESVGKELLLLSPLNVTDFRCKLADFGVA